MVPTLASGRQMKRLVEEALYLFYEASTEAGNHDEIATLPNVDALVETFSKVQDFMEGHVFHGTFPECYFNEVNGFEPKWTNGVTECMGEFLSLMNDGFGFNECYNTATKHQRIECFMAFMKGMSESTTSKYL